MAFSPRNCVDDIAERLRLSDRPDYRTSTFLAFHQGEVAYPVLLSDKSWDSGMWVVGAARSGKTQRVLASLGVQRIRRNNCPVVFIDCKGDDVLLQTMKREADALGREFLLLSNVPRFPTRLFNPLTQPQLALLNRSSITEMHLTALNLFFGFTYGKAFFSAQSYQGFSEAYIADEPSQGWGPGAVRVRARSFVEMAKRLPRVLKRRPEIRGAEALMMVLRQLSDVFLLNAGCCGIYPEAAVAGAIQISQILRPCPNGTYPILYCYLRAESEPVTSSVIGKLVLNHLKNALSYMKDAIRAGEVDGPMPVVPTFIDECQIVLDDALKNMLEQGASLGMQFVLANQDVSQLRTGDRDYLQTVSENCGNKVILTARDNSFQELLMKLSGEKATHHLSYTIGGDAIRRGALGPESSVDGFYKVAEMISPRFERNHVIEMSATPGRAIFIPAMDDGLTQYRGYPIFVDLPFVHSPETFEQLNRRPWPAATPEMVVPNQYRDSWEAFLAEEFRPKRKATR